MPILNWMPMRNKLWICCCIFMNIPTAVRLLLMKSRYLLPRFRERPDESVFSVPVPVPVSVSVSAFLVAVLNVVLLTSRWLPLSEINAISLSVSLELDACSVTGKEALAKFVGECVKNRTTTRPTTTRLCGILTQHIFSSIPSPPLAPANVSAVGLNFDCLFVFLRISQILVPRRCTCLPNNSFTHSQYHTPTDLIQNFDIEDLCDRLSLRLRYNGMWNGISSERFFFLHRYCSIVMVVAIVVVVVQTKDQNMKNSLEHNAHFISIPNVCVSPNVLITPISLVLILSLRLLFKMLRPHHVKPINYYVCKCLKISLLVFFGAIDPECQTFHTMD